MPSISADGIYYVDLGPDWTFSPGSFVSVYPENLEFDDMIRGVGNCSFALTYSARDQDGNAAVPVPTNPGNVPFIGPYRSYYRLRCGNVEIQAGVIISTSSHRGDHFMSIAGKSWEHFFEKWQYPYDPRPTNVNDFVIGTPPTGLVYQVANTDLITILSDLLVITMNVPNRVTFDLSTLVGNSGITTNYQFSLGDMSYFMSIVEGLADTQDGFDWWIGTGRKLYWAVPYRYGSPANPTYMATFDDTVDPEIKPIIDTSFTNNGPAATHMTGRGAGLAVQTILASALGSDVNEIEFSRLDADVDVGDVRNRNQVVARTQKELAKVVQPGHDIPISVQPSLYTGGDMAFWQTFRKGRAVHITHLDYGYHIVESGQRIKAYKAHLDEEMSLVVDWSLEQIYDYSLNSGTPEG